MNEMNVNNQSLINENLISVQTLNKSNKIHNNNDFLDKSEDINSINKFDDIQNTKNISKIEDLKIDNKFEYTITNNMFSFNREAEEFVVKVERNGNINQYPSEEMLKMKQFLMNQSA